jgi:flagellin-like protein
LRFKKRSGVSPVIAELLLIAITVAIGTLVYSFASTAFGGFGSGFSNLVQNAGGQLSENVVVEQVYFLQNSTGNGGSCPVTAVPVQAGECAGDIFLGNVGSNTAIINQIYVDNVSGIPSSVVTSANLKFWGHSVILIGAGDKYNVALPAALAGCAPATCLISIAPGQTVMLRFVTTDPVVPGTTYSFTLITARGNQIVAYEKA